MKMMGYEERGDLPCAVRVSCGVHPPTHAKTTTTTTRQVFAEDGEDVWRKQENLALGAVSAAVFGRSCTYLPVDGHTRRIVP